MTGTTVVGPPFDAVAASYDSVFTRTPLGSWLRSRVWAQLEGAFAPGMRVLELGCGTGEDALWLARRGVRVLATDSSPEMLEIARRKAAGDVAGRLVSFAMLNLNAPQLPQESPPVVDGPPFDGALSNFGGLNCAQDRHGVARFLSRLVRSGGRVALVVMGPWCPWEVAWYSLQGDWRKATRRWGLRGIEAEVAGRLVRVWYPSPARLRRDFVPWFRGRGIVGVGAIVPPPHLRGLVEVRPWLFGRLQEAEGRLAAVWPFTILNDHYLLELERTDCAPG